MATVEQSETTVVTLTERAATKIGALMASEPAGEAEVLRVAIQGGGCSGFEYALGFDRGAQSGDHELEFHGVRVVVDPFSAPYLQGATIDFLETLQESGLQDREPERRLRVRLRFELPGRRGCRGRRRRLRLRLRPRALNPADVSLNGLLKTCRGRT